jgi:PAS domain S-box-containing protein
VNDSDRPILTFVQPGVSEREERLLLAAEAVGMFSWEIDFRSGVLNWGPNAAKVIGCKPEDLAPDLDKGAFFAVPEDRPRMLSEFQDAVESGSETYSLGFRGKDSRGEDRFWQVRGKFIRNANGVIERAIGATQDITAQKTAENELRLVAERLSTAEEAAGALIYDWNVETGKIWRSSGLTRILGWRTEELGDDHVSWVSLRHPDDAELASSMPIQDFAKDNEDYVVEYRVRHRDGHYVWVLDSGRIFKNESGKVVRVAGATIDISSRKKVEASSSRRANLIDLSFEPIFVWHPTKGIVEWNRGAEQLYGYSREEAIGKPSHSLLHTISPLPSGELIDILKVGKSWTGELEHQAKDGRQIFVESRHQLIETDGETFILETNHDISQRKRAETYTARMAAVAIASHDALFGITLDGIIETWNAAAERIFGYSASEAIGKHISILADPSRHEEQQNLIGRALGGDTIGPYDARRMRKDGTFVDVSVSLAPVKAADGSVMSISVAVHDISDRVEWEARQKLMTRELAHRIKNSFAVLQGILRSTLRTSKDPQEFAEAFSGRLHSLSAAQDVLTANDWRGAELAALIRHQLAAYVVNEDSRVEISGPRVNLPAEYAAPFGLIFNELATNALKYGALSVPEGNIVIMWRTERNPDFSEKIFLTWRERGGPTVTGQGSRGFGTTLIEKSLAGAKIENIFEPEGLTCKIELTLKTLSRLKAKRKSRVPHK